MSDFLTHLNKLLRYCVSGFVGLAVVAAIDTHDATEDMALLAMKKSVDSWWPILFLGVVIGVVTYNISLTILFRVYAPSRNYLWKKCEGWKPRILTWFTRWDSRATEHLRTVRWILRQPGLTQDEARKVFCELRAKQALADEWSAHIHLLVCSALVTAAAPIVMLTIGRTDGLRLLLSVGAAIVLCLFAIWNDLHCEHLKRDITGAFDDWKGT